MHYKYKINFILYVAIHNYTHLNIIRIFGYSDIYSNTQDMVSTIHICTIFLNGGGMNIHKQSMDAEIWIRLLVFVYISIRKQV